MLDGEWLIAEEGDNDERLSGEWNDTFVADVPCSIHTALFKAGRIKTEEGRLVR